jgi:hypothetical protein
MRLGEALKDPWGMLLGAFAGGLGWAVGIPAGVAVGVGAIVWGVRSAVATATERGADEGGDGPFDPEAVRRALSRLRRRVKGRVPDDILDRVDEIIAAIEGILPRAGGLGPGSQDLFVLLRTATDYLPTTLEAYVNLPRRYATEHVISEGKTAHEVVVEQLDLLASQLQQIAIAVNKNDTDKILSHGRFLEQRFGRKDLSIGGDESSEP